MQEICESRNCSTELRSDIPQIQSANTMQFRNLSRIWNPGTVVIYTLQLLFYSDGNENVIKDGQCSMIFKKKRKIVKLLKKKCGNTGKIIL